MRPRFRAKIIFSVSAAVALLSLRPTFSQEKPAKEYRITAVHGEVGVLPVGQKELSPATTGLLILPGDRLITHNGTTEVAAQDGTIFALKENSHLQFQSITDSLTALSLRLGRFIGKFAKKEETQRSYRISAPVAVASIRGTELAMDVEEDGEMQSGVAEGTVAFTPPSPDDLKANENIETDDAPQATLPVWEEKEVVVEENQGIVASSTAPAMKTLEIPALVVPVLKDLPSLREHMKSVREQWTAADFRAQLDERHKAFLEKVKWEAPPKLLRGARPGPKSVRDLIQEKPQPQKPSIGKPQPGRIERRPRRQP